MQCWAQPRPTLATPWAVDRQAPLSTEFPGKHSGVGFHFLLQRICPAHVGKGPLGELGSPESPALQADSVPPSH